MYSMPQHAVTNGYWKMEYLRAQPIASSSRLVRNPASPNVSLPVECAIVPRVEEPHHEDSQKDDHLRQPEGAEPAKDHRPRVEEHKLDVEKNEQNRGQIELDRQAADGQRERNLPALERLRFHGRRPLRAEQLRQQDVQAREPARDHECDHDSEILSHPPNSVGSKVKSQRSKVKGQKSSQRSKSKAGSRDTRTCT